MRSNAGRSRTHAAWLLLLSLLLTILLYPVLDHSDWRRVILGGLMFAPVMLSTIRLAQEKGWVWPSVLLTLGTVSLAVANMIAPNRVLVASKWAVLAAFFGLTVVGLFSYLRDARLITPTHLYTAASIYLSLGMFWFALYGLIDVVAPGAIQLRSSATTGRQSELLYFSLVTLSTIGYGDIVPLGGDVRMLAALEGVTGVLYLAITVGILVSAYRQERR